MTDIENLKYPIGRFKYETGRNDVDELIDRISTLPQRLRAEVEGLSESQLGTPYREGGWTLRQVVHHIADSHINAYSRFKLAMTETNPEIRPYNEGQWAECEDAKHSHISLSLELIEALHKRWVFFLRTLNKDDLQRTYYHPVNKKQSALLEVISMYAWHGDHHLAHIAAAKRRNKWQDN